MIVKKVSFSKTAPVRSKAINIRKLADYIAGPQAGDVDEKVEHRGALNMLSIDHADQVQEMVDLAEVAKRSPMPVQHWIMSWQEGEQPSPEQADRAVETFLEEMGLTEHQAIYALHRDTDNWHLHLAVNRVHPETEKVVTVNNGFDHEVAHRAIARIEHAQGWGREANGLYRVQQDGCPERVESRDERERKPSASARQFEERKGERSAERIAIEDAAPIIRQATSWQEIHEHLGPKGLRFERKGSGALLWVGDQPVKASAAGRDCSLAALQKRIGDFEPAVGQQPGQPPVRLAPEPVTPAAPAWEAYRVARERHLAERATFREQLSERHAAEWSSAREYHRSERREILRGSWKGRGQLLNATRSVLAARQAQEKAAMRDQLQREREAGRREFGRFPDYDQWLRQRSRELGDQWRHRERQPAVIEGPSGRQTQEATPQDIRAFVASVDGWRVHYHRAAGRGGPAFTDKGREVQIHDHRTRDSVLAALQLSAQKWGTFHIRGDAQFRRVCIELAAEHGFRITNPDLQQAITAEHGRIRAARETDRQREARTTKPTEIGPQTVARSLGEVYRRHLAEIEKDVRARRADPSRRDALVAVRMRVTGHSREAIARAIREGGSAHRPREKRDWDTYAKRAAEFAFGVPGGHLANRLTRDLEVLLQLEGRALERDFIRTRAHLDRGGPER